MTPDYPWAIRAALQQTDEPMSPQELASAIGVSWPTLKPYVETLIDQGKVAATGKAGAKRFGTAMQKASQ